MVKNGQFLFAMKNIQDIAKVGFKPPNDEHLAVEAMSIADLQSRAPVGHFRKLQRADFYRLIGVENGQTSLMVDFSTYTAQARRWLLVRPGQVMRYDFSTDWGGWILVFRPDGWVSPGRSNQANETGLSRYVDDLACLHSLDQEQHEWMIQSMRQIQRDGALKVDVNLRNEMMRLQLASTLLRLSVWNTTSHEPEQYKKSYLSAFKRFQKCVETDFAKHHQVQHYANALFMSEKSLSRLCLATTGVSAKNWISQRLCLEAKRLLAHTTMSVQSIGNELGYEDASNFVKFFRAQAGVTPLAFRHANQWRNV